MRIFYILLCLLVADMHVLSNNCLPHIINYSTADGLSHNSINCMYEDSKGFLWVGTSCGLNRFDGYSFKTFFKNDDDSLSFPGLNIEDIVEDRLGKIWISCEEGVFCYNPKYEVFEKMNLFEVDGNIGARKLCIDDEGFVWTIVKNNYLVKLYADENPVKMLINIDSLIKSKENHDYFQINFIDGYFWISGTNGLLRFNKKNQETIKVIYDRADLWNSRKIKKGGTNEILMVVGDIGIYSINTKTLQQTLFKKEALYNDKFKLSLISDVEFSADSSRIVGGFPGLFSVASDGSICRFNNAANQSANFDKMIVTALYKDAHNNIWVGTLYDGLYVINTQAKAFQHYTLNFEDYKGLHARKIFVTDSKIFTCNLHGAFSIDKRTGETTTITETPTYSVSENPINKNEIIFYSSSQMFIYNIKTEKLQLHKSKGPIQDSYVDSRGIIWIMHWSEIIEGYDIKNDTSYFINIDNSTSENNFVFTMLEDKDTSLWLGTYGAGMIHVMNPLSKMPIIKHYSSKKGENSISHNVVLSLYDDGNGVLWIGTNGGGLNRFDKNTETFEIFTKKNGLQSNLIGAIHADNEKNIWFVSTVLSKWDAVNKTFSHFGSIEGVQSKYFTGAIVKDQHGVLYIGDDRGILAFDPANVKRETLLKTPIITNIKLFGNTILARQKYGETVPFPVSIEYTDTITLPYNLNALSLSFSSLNSINDKSLIYAYKMDGVKDEWYKISGDDRTISFAGMQPGTYTLHIKTSYDELVWSEVKTLHIIISPPWWSTWWFRLVLILTLSCIVALIVVYRFIAIKKINKQLELKVKERTASLEQSNELLEENQIIVEVKNAQLSESMLAKDKLLSVIAHDFKNALSGIMGMATVVQNEGKKINSEKISKFSQSIFTSSNSVINQMKTLLDWAQSQDANLKAKPVEINIEMILEDIIELEKVNAVNKSIKITTQSDYTMNACVDPRMASMAFRNILSNAIKYSPKNSSIIIMIQELENSIDTTFIDAGAGIEQEVVDALFNNSAPITSKPGTDNERGQGLGLRLCKTFIENNAGTLNILNFGKGTICTVSFPKGNKKATKKSAIQFDTIGDNKLKPASAETYTILIIDDAKEIVEYIEDSLTGTYKIIKALDGQDGLNIAQQMLPDLILCDNNLPFKSGIEICKTLKNSSLTSHIPIIIISSSTDEELKNLAYSSGANDFIEKPFNILHLTKKVETLLTLGIKIREKLQKEINSTQLLPENFDNKIIKKVIDFVNQNISNEHLSTNMVAENIGISRTQLWRIFKNSIGTSLSDYITELRMQKAWEMLKSGRYRINEIAFEIGFSDPRYFTRSFTKKYGIPPTEFAENHNKASSFLKKKKL
ncbi:MAG: response regulator [Bacteroidales bacterium]|nr:response regulator [Bacteroidales bacterium]